MRFYYRTSTEDITRILECGFHGATDRKTLQGDEPRGFRVSDQPPDRGESTAGKAVLQFALKMPKTKLDKYKVKQVGKSYHEWDFPAALLKGAKPTIAKNTLEVVLQAGYGKGQLTAQLMAAFWTQYFHTRWLGERLRRQGRGISAVENLEQEYQGVEWVYTSAIIQQIARAIKTGDASYLRDFAIAIEEQGCNRIGRDPARLLIAGLKLAGGEPRTIAQINQTLEAHGHKHGNTRHLYDICDEIGYRYAKGQEGHPPKETVKPPSK
jgi:hypothetical protein